MKRRRGQIGAVAARQGEHLAPAGKCQVQVMPALLASVVSLPAQAHSGPPASLIVGSLWGTLAYAVAAMLFVLASNDGRRMRRFLLCVVCFPVWWCAVEFSVAPFLDHPPWDMAIATAAPLALLVYAVRYLMRSRSRGRNPTFLNR